MVSVEGAASTTEGEVDPEESSVVEASGSGEVVASGSEAAKSGEDDGGVSGISTLGGSWPQPTKVEAIRINKASISSLLHIRNLL
jgi:hypothetical protein